MLPRSLSAKKLLLLHRVLLNGKTKGGYMLFDIFSKLFCVFISRASLVQVTLYCLLEVALHACKIKHPQVMSMVKSGPTALNFGYDFVLLIHFLGYPVPVGCLIPTNDYVR